MKAAVVVRYQSTIGAKWRTGVAIVNTIGTSDIGSIIDVDDNTVVDEVHDYVTCYVFGTMIIPNDELFPKKDR